MANRVREHQVIFRVTEAEKELIRRRMALLGTRNMQSFLRKMALDGYVVKLELPELKEMVSCCAGAAITSTRLPGMPMKRAACIRWIWKKCWPCSRPSGRA